MSPEPVIELTEPPPASAPPRTRPAAPRPGEHPVSAYLGALHARYAGLDAGEVATYIPELAHVSPDLFGIALVTCDGAVYEAGDSRTPFTLQSVSKPLTYGLALDLCGEAEVRRRVGIEPSGDAFNSISLHPDTGTPLNPMINAGAIATAAVVGRAAGDDALDRLLETYGAYAGRQLEVDRAVFRSESETGHRNRAIGHLLRNAGVIEDEPERALELYFQQCAVAVECVDLAAMAATLANGGVNPLTGERAVGEGTVRKVLSVMATCGMYDYAGAWLYAVGLPAKSGVSGGIMAVLPGQLGLAVFSPRLDARGNSVRGVRVCEDVSREFDLHLVQPRRRPAPAVRASYDLGRVGSKRVRSERQAAALAELGPQALVLELQGDVSFAAAEEIASRLSRAVPRPALAILDFRRVGRVDPTVAPLLAHLVAGFAARGAELALTGLDGHADCVPALEGACRGAGADLLTFPELDLALEWAERTLLSADGDLDAGAIALADHEVLRGLPPDGLDRLLPWLREARFEAGAVALRRGDASLELLLVTRGHLSVTADLPDGSRKRLATVSAGMVLGELSIGGTGRRTADVRADTDVECHTLSADALAALTRTDPDVACVVLANLLRVVSRTAHRMTDELAALAS